MGRRQGRGGQQRDTWARNVNSMCALNVMGEESRGVLLGCSDVGADVVLAQAHDFGYRSLGGGQLGNSMVCADGHDTPDASQTMFC